MTLKAPDDPAIYIEQPDPIHPYENVWQAVCKVESNFDIYAIGDKHLKEWSYGISQIRKVRLDHYYNLTGIRYSEKDMFDPEKSKEVFLYFADRIGPYDIERVARSWNGKWSLTDEYYAKIQKVLLKL